VIPWLALSVLELLAIVWACALLWINAGLRAEITKLRGDRSKAIAAAARARAAAGLPPLGGYGGGERPLSEGEIEPPPVAPPQRWPGE